MFVFRIYNRVSRIIDTVLPEWILPLLARVIFFGVLFVPYMRSALNKFGDGFTGLFFMDVGAYVQIFPKALESVGYDQTQLSFFHHLTVFIGSYSEIIIPVLIVLGLVTRLASLGMIGFLIVQSWVDIFGHGLGADDIGSWFDNITGSVIVDQRAFWIFLLLYLVIKGAGRVSLDSVICKYLSKSSS